MMLDIPVGSPSLAAVPDDVTVFLEQINIAPDIAPVAINLVKIKRIRTLQKYISISSLPDLEYCCYALHFSWHFHAC